MKWIKTWLTICKTEDWAAAPETFAPLDVSLPPDSDLVEFRRPSVRERERERLDWAPEAEEVELELWVRGARGSTEKSSSTAIMSPEVRLNGAVGRATPNLTGARRAFAVSQSSSRAMARSAWKTRLQRWTGWLAACSDFFLLWPGDISTLKTTKMRMTERTNLKTS